ncbi:MAG: AzlD domain-containing protein [Clostridia bacterium]|nr:AzlD domain-containing protein [Clostridia bacterium]
MRLEIVLLVVLMALVTYVPRMLPSFIIGKIKIGKKTEKFLRLIPYTAMAALIFPGILNSVGDKAYYGLAGGAVAALLAYFKCPVVVCVIAAVAVDYILVMLP